jgi:hypothetical protein
VRSEEQRQSARLHREVNKRIREVAGTFPANGTLEFLCECGRPDCHATIALTEAQFDSFLNGGGSVLLAAEHAAAADGSRFIADEEAADEVALPGDSRRP